MFGVGDVIYPKLVEPSLIRPYVLSVSKLIGGRLSIVFSDGSDNIIYSPDDLSLKLVCNSPDSSLSLPEA